MQSSETSRKKPHKIKVLLVEEEPGEAKIALAALQDTRLNIEVILLENGAEAVNYLSAFPGLEKKDLPQLILMNLHAPKPEGMEALRKIKSDPRTEPIPVVIMTASQEETDVIESYKLGVNSYILKPVGYENFVEAVKEIGTYWGMMNQPVE